MSNNENYKILQLRNETSLYLDDLVAMVINSTLASQLRSFSGEVMDLRPGFAFDFKQALTLKDLTRKTLRDYERKKIGDVELMNYQNEANTILKGETLQTGGEYMSFLDRLLHAREIKEKESNAALEKEYQDVLGEIAKCQEVMDRCVKESSGHSPDSRIYRDNERKYLEAKKELNLLQASEDNLSKVLSEAKRMQLVKEHNERLKKMAHHAEHVLNNSTKTEIEIARIDIINGKLQDLISDSHELSGRVFDGAEKREEPRTNSEFGARVAANEHQQALYKEAGIVDSQMSKDEIASKTEFGALVHASSAHTEE